MTTNESGTSGRAADDLLPEDFFDSSKKSKKVKDDELVKELEQFEKEMAALEAESEEQLKEEFEKLQEEKNIEELDQQLEQWKRVVELEKKAEELRDRLDGGEALKRAKLTQDDSSERALEQPDHDDLDDIEDFEDELSNWRKKGI